MVGCRDLYYKGNKLKYLNIKWYHRQICRQKYRQIVFLPKITKQMRFGSTWLIRFHSFLILPNYSCFGKVVAPDVKNF
jgi:hypothetical protein